MANIVTTNDNEKCEKALTGLYDVIDPEIGLNVVDLGLIYRIDFVEDAGRIDLIMTLTTQFCPMGEAITGGVMNSVTDAFPGWDVNVQLTFDPPWSFERISPEGKQFLGH